jgi:hypothetical protein
VKRTPRAVLGDVIAIGWALNQSLQRPRWEIEYVYPGYFYKRRQLPPEVMNPILQTSLLEAQLRAHFERHHQGDDDCVDRLEHGEIKQGCAEKLRQTSVAVLKILQSEQEAVKQNLDRIRNETYKELGFRPMQATRQELLSLDPGRRSFALKGHIPVIEGMIKALEPLINELKQPEPEYERSEHVLFRVGILNSGHSDGVIKSRAILRFGGNQMVELAALEYTVIKAHSFGSITFSVVGDAGAPGSWEALNQIVATKGEMKVDIQLKSGSDTVVGKGALGP